MVALLPRPDHLFEAAFFNTDDGPVWVNLSDYVELNQGIKAGKRRQTVFDDVAPATFDIFLDNSTGVFNNDRADSPFAGLVNLDVPVRFRLRWPNVPTTTANMLNDVQSAATDDGQFTADMGTLDTDTVTPPAGMSSDVVWTTGLLDQVGASVMTGVGPTRAPDDHPVYVRPSTTYSARVQVKDDTNGTGISFKASLRMRWFDIDGTLLSETASAPLTLTTSYQSLSVTGTSPATATSVRVGVFNETVVAPAVRAIAFDGFDSQCQHWGTTMHATIPSTADVGDIVLAWVRTNSTSITINTPAGWTSKTSWADTRGKTTLFYRVVTSTDIGKGYAFTTSAACGYQILLTAYTGVSQATPINQYLTVTESTFRTTHTTPNVTTTVAGCWIVSAAFDVSSTTTAWGAPAGESVRTTGYRTGGNSPTGITTDNAAAVGTGTYGTKVFTANSSSKYASMATVALAPASGTGPGTVTVQIGKWELVQGSLGVWAQGGHWESKFTGLVDSWRETYAGDLTLTAVSATDRQKQLATINIGSAIHEVIRAQSPVAYYPLSESGTGTGTTQEAGNAADVTQNTLTQKQFGTGGVINWGQGTGPAVDGTSAVVLAPVDRSNGIALTTVFSNPMVNANAVTLFFFWNSAVADATSHVLMRLQDASNGQNPRGYIHIGGTPNSSINATAVIASEAATVTVVATKTGQYFDGKTHAIAATAAITGGQLVVTLFIDGNQQAQTASACAVAQFPTLSLAGVGCAASASYICGGTYSNAAWFNSALDPGTIASFSVAGTTAFAGDTIDQRIGRLCGWENQDGVTLDATSTVCARHMPDAQSLLSAVQQAARSEGGTVYVDGDGLITFRSRVNKEQTAVPLITCAASHVQPGSFAKVTDDQLLVNKPVIKRLDTQVTSTVIDPVSAGIHGIHEKDVDTILASNTDALNYATYLLAFYSVPQPRCEQVTIEALLLQDWSHVLLISMWQLIRITGLPSVEQTATIDLFIEGWEINLNADSWSITFDTSTAIPFGILNDAARGVCGASVAGW